MTSEDWKTVLLALIAAVVTLGGPVIAFQLAKVASQQSQTVKAVGEVKTLVDGNDSNMKARLQEMNERLLVSAQNNASLVEAARLLSEQVKLTAARAEVPARTQNQRVTDRVDEATPLPVKIIDTVHPLPVILSEEEEEKKQK